MKKPSRRTAEATELSRAKSDFTFEGSSSPGHVSAVRPAGALDTFDDRLSTNQGLLLSDNHNSLKAGIRGPTLLEDFILREKITHFDHERIPERAVHARGAGAHGFFQVYESQAPLTRAGFLGDPTIQTPVFVRFSTVAGARGSADTVRDARGFAVKFYTPEGNYDLVGNNIPVFFIQDAIKFPDLVHAVKPEPHNEIPQAASAHDTFWDFASLMPEATHMLMWVMSDRGLPRSLRMMEGFGVHTFRLINSAGAAHFVKFHWKPRLGVHALLWDEAQELAGRDPDFHRRDLWAAIDSGQFPEWELGWQVVSEADEHRFGFDLLDPTKLIPEELVPVQRIGRLVLNRNPDNFFAETEQVAFHPGHLVPGIDFSSDPLLQGRLFSYTDTQLSRLGGPNFHELPINRGICPVYNFQRDGQHRQMVASGQVAYEPHSLGAGDEFRVDGRTFEPVGATGFTHHPEILGSPKQRGRSPSFEDHFSQARLFWNSQSPTEQDHLVAAFQFELSKLNTPAIRQRMVDNLAHVDSLLATRVAGPLGISEPAPEAAAAWPGFRHVLMAPDMPPSPSLSMHGHPYQGIATRHVAVLVADGVDAVAVEHMRQQLESAGAQCTLVAPTLGNVRAAGDACLSPHATLDNVTSVAFDALFIPPMEPPASRGVHNLARDPRAIRFVAQIYRHGKAVAVASSGADLLDAALGQLHSSQDHGRMGAVAPLAGLVRGEYTQSDDFVSAFKGAIGAHRHWERGEGLAIAQAG